VEAYGFREIEHTADWEIEAWAPDPAGLLEQAALGMYALSGMRLHPTQRVERDFTLSGADQETLLVKFLHELIFLGEQEGLGFDRYDLRITQTFLDARLSGAPILAQNREIKAVTYHNLAIRTTPNGLAVNLVFDV